MFARRLIVEPAASCTSTPSPQPPSLLNPPCRRPSSLSQKCSIRQIWSIRQISYWLEFSHWRVQETARSLTAKVRACDHLLPALCTSDTGLPRLLRYRWAAWVEESLQRRTGALGRGCRLQMSADAGSALWRIRLPSAEAVSRIRSRRGERYTAALAAISRGIPRSMEGTSDRTNWRQIASMAVRAPICHQEPD